MPHRLWQHCCAPPGTLDGSPTCRGCGAQGIFDSWHLSLWEAVGKYCYTYELQPWGPHRGLADKLLTAMRDTCVHCGGACILTIDEETWQDCLACESTGGVWNRPFAEVDAVWSLITKRWPHAAMPWVGRRPQQPREEQREQPALAAPAPAVPDVAVAVCTPGTQTARRVRARRSTGVSPDGISYDALRRVFAQAQRALGTEWQLFGRGHCERVTLKAHYSRHARLGAQQSVMHFAPSGSMARVYVFPAALVRRAADKLKVDASLLISRYW